MDRVRSPIIILVLAGLLAGCGSLKLNPYSLDTEAVGLPFNIPISYDDFTYDSHLHRVIIPAGETGQVALIDPTNLQAELITGFSRQVDPADPIIGTSAVAVAGGFLYGLDQETMSIKTIDLSTGNLVASTPVRAAPDYIRFVSATNEVWVTEKNSNQIEIFTISADNPPVPQSTGVISIPNGPEALVIDDQRGLAFTNRPNQGLTDVIQVMTHTVIAHWGNGCSSARGMAVDENDGYLIVACEEGKLVVMDINNDGYQITSQNYGGELDSVAYNPNLHHVYLPSSASGLVAIFQLQTLQVTPEPTLANPPGTTPAVSLNTDPGATQLLELKTSLLLLGTADTDVKARCVTTDEYNNIWVCDPNNGQVFFIHDAFPDSSTKP
jgi:DNA-binding beta-propeller fold protein YncE